MLIALPLDMENGCINSHYGKSDHLVLFTCDGGFIQNKEIIELKLDGQSIASYCKELGVDVLIIDHCGPNALESIKEAKIKLVCGIDLGIEDAVDKYLQGKLKSNMERFNDHKHDHH